MARKKTRQAAEQPPQQGDETMKGPPQHALRFDDPLLLQVLDTYADEQRQSRNSAILTIIEQAMRAKGLWPPHLSTKAERTQPEDDSLPG